MSKTKKRKRLSTVKFQVWNLKYPQIETIKTCIPALAEQEKIADFLMALDQRIEKQRTLVEHLKKYKRGVIKEFLNPQTCPIKNAVWSKATIGELGTFVKGAPLSKADISDEGTPFILYGELYTTYDEVINQVVRRTRQSVDDSYLSRIGDVVIPTSGETPEEIATEMGISVDDITYHITSLIPYHPTLENYKTLFNDDVFWIALKNTTLPKKLQKQKLLFTILHLYHIKMQLALKLVIQDMLTVKNVKNLKKSEFQF